MPIWKLKSSIRQHAAAIYSVCEGELSSSIFTASGDKYVAKWNLENFTQDKFSVKLDAAVYSCCFIPEYNFLLIGLSNGSIHVVDLQSKKELKHYVQHQSAVFHFNYSLKKGHFYSVSGDGLFCVWSLKDLSLKLALPLCSDKIRKIAVAPNESKIALACGDGIIRLLETDYYNEIAQLEGHGMSVNALCFLSDTLLVSGGKDAHLCVWDITINKLLQSIPAHNFAIYAVAKSPCGNYFATASRDKTIKIWDANSFKVLQRLDRKSDGHLNSVNDIVWTNFNNYIISVGDDRCIKVWEEE